MKTTGQDIRIREFDQSDLPAVYRLVQNTIEEVYKDVYPVEAIEFFRCYHSRDNITNDAAAGYTIVAVCGDETIGTATLLGSNMRRVFIKPSHQHKGIGKLLVDNIERKASLEQLTMIDLDASIVSRSFWESLGFLVQTEEHMPVENNKELVYFRMFKRL